MSFEEFRNERRVITTVDFVNRNARLVTRRVPSLNLLGCHKLSERPTYHELRIANVNHSMWISINIAVLDTELEFNCRLNSGLQSAAGRNVYILPKHCCTAGWCGNHATQCTTVRLGIETFHKIQSSRLKVTEFVLAALVISRC